MNEDKRMSEIAKAFTALANSLNAVADAMVKKQAEEVKNKAEAPVAKKEEEQFTLEQVRAVLAGKSKNGHTAEIRQLLVKHGADKLSAINPDEYRALMKEAGEL